MSWLKLFGVVLTILVCNACSEVPATNPYDPNTPPSQVAQGMVIGAVTLPDGFRQLEATVELRSNVAPAEAAYSKPIDQDGSFLIENVVPGGYGATVKAQGFTANELGIEVPIGGTVEGVNFVLTAITDGTIEGVVTRAGGAAANSGILVEAIGTPFTTQTAADGAFRLVVVAGTHTLRASATGYQSVETEGIEVLGGRSVNVDPILLLGSPGRLKGSVSLEHGFAASSALAQVDVTLIRRNDGTEIAQVRPDAQGAYLFDEIAAGAYRVEATLPGFVQRAVDVEVNVGATSSAVHIHLPPAIEEVLISGQVQRNGAEGQSGVSVSLTDADAEVTTNETGRFAIRVRARTQPDYTLQIAARGYTSQTVVVPAPTAEQIETAGDIPISLIVEEPIVLLGLPGTIRGRVSLATGFEDPVLLSQTSLRLLAFGAEEPTDQVNPDPEGFFVLGNVPPGPYIVEYALAGFLPLSTSLSLEPGGEALLEPQVMSPDLASTQAYIQGIARRQCEGICDHGGIRVEATNTTFVTLTNSEGQYRLEVVNRQNFTLRFSADGYLTQELGDIDAVTGQTTEAPEVLLEARPGTIRAAVALRRYSTGERLQDVDVALLADPPDQILRQANPDSEGQVLFENIVPGRYIVRADAEGFDAREIRITILPGEEGHAGLLDLPHQSETQDAVPLAGIITLNNAENHSGTEVRVAIAGADIALGQPLITNAEGAFEITASPEERYVITVERPGYLPIAQLGPYTWNTENARFEARDAPISAELLRNPVDGLISLTVAITPAWLPEAEKYVRVRLDGPVNESLERVSAGQEISFSPLPEGIYSVRIERSGFTTVSRLVAITPSNSVHQLEVLTAKLNDLAAARLDLRGELLSVCDLRSGLNLRGADLSGVTLVGSVGIAEDDCDAVIEGPLDLSDVKFIGADLQGASFASTGAQVNLDGADFSGANITQTDLTNISARSAVFSGAQGAQAAFVSATLSGANFTGADLTEAFFVGVNPAPNPAWPDLLDPSEPQPDVPCSDEDAVRPSVKLDGATFADANLTGAFLPGVNLSQTLFAGAAITGADLRYTCLADARLTLIDFSNAVLDGADLSNAELTGSLLRKTSLRGTNLMSASMVNTVIDQADIRSSPHLDCEELIEWSEYKPGGFCENNYTNPCNCRTRMENVALDGANLVGASLQGVDLADASMLGITFGDSDRLAFIQPPSCLPELYYECMSIFQMSEECGHDPEISIEEWQTICTTTPVPNDDEDWYPVLGDGYDPERKFCLINNYLDQKSRTGSCDSWDQFNCSRNSTPNLWQNDCTFDAITAAEDRSEVPQCEFLAQYHVMERCLVAPTVLQDTRLDRAQMVSVTLNGVEMSDTSMRATTMRSGIFIDNQLTSSLDLSYADFRDSTMTEVVLQGHNLTGTNFSGAILRRADFSGSEIAEADFSDAIMRGSILADHDQQPKSLQRSDLRDAELTNLPWGTEWGQIEADQRLEMSNVDLSGAHLTNVDLSYANISYANLSNTNFYGYDAPINFTGALLNSSIFNRTSGDATFDMAHMSSVNIIDASFYNGSFRGTIMTNGHVRFLEAGRSSFQHADFGGARLNQTFIENSQFSYVNFSSLANGECGAFGQPNCVTSFRDTRGSQNLFNYGNFDGACMRDMVMTDSDFRNASIRNVYLTDSDFSGSIFSSAVFDHTDLTNTRFTDGNVAGADFRLACGMLTWGMFDGAYVHNARMCSNQRASIELRSDFTGTPRWETCNASPNCPSICY